MQRAAVQNKRIGGEIVKKAVLAVSFGTSYNDTRERTIGAIEKRLAQGFPEYEICRAFTSGMIIKKLRERDGEIVKDTKAALAELVKGGIDEVIIQPTHIMNGFEFDKLSSDAALYKEGIPSIKIGAPLLTSDSDYKSTVRILAEEIPAVKDKDTAVVLVGHGTEHYANSAYAALDYYFKAAGFANVFVGTVEAYPDIDKVTHDIAAYKRAVLSPFMIVAGDHANNDICGGADSWYSRITDMGIEVECINRGIGEYEKIQEMFVRHAMAARELV